MYGGMPIVIVPPRVRVAGLTMSGFLITGHCPPRSRSAVPKQFGPISSQGMPTGTTTAPAGITAGVLADGYTKVTKMIPPGATFVTL